MIKIDPTLPKPYTSLTFLKKEPLAEDTINIWGSVNRKYYQQYFYIKSYSTEKRVAIFRKCINNLATSYGRSLFTSKHWRLLKKVCWGASVKQVRVLDPWIKIETLSSNPMPNAREVRAFEQARLESLQRDLDQKKIPLNCLNPPKLTQKNHRNEEVVRAYFKELEEKKWYGEKFDEWLALHRRLFDAVDKITFDELQKSLFLCSQHLNSLLGSNPYAVGFAALKSSKWIAELALPYLSGSPTAHFRHATDNLLGGRSYQTPIPGIRHFVIFDDASYSGEQLVTVIRQLRNAVGDLPTPQNCTLYLVIPFLSCHAVKALTNLAKFGSAAINGKLEVRLITTDRRVKALSDVLSDQDFDRLTAIEGESVHEYLNGRTNNKCLTFTEWKVPDTNSLPRPLTTWHVVNSQGTRLIEKGRFITDFSPPYKKP